jgi:hypothetical protein
LETSLQTWNEILTAYPGDVIATVFVARINGTSTADRHTLGGEGSTG